MDFSGMDAVATLAAAADGVRRRRATEVNELELAGHWAVLHGEPRGDRDPMVSTGGEGTPEVREFCLPELAMARETHAVTTRNLIADALDLIHRLPETWAAVRALTCEPWVARKVAVLSRAVPRATVGIVDRAVARAIAGHAPSTVLQIVQAKVIEADPATHAARREQARHERYVTLSRADEFGYRHVIAKVTAGDAAWIDAMVDRVADILATTHGADHNRDELRSLAMGWLARPAELLRLLLDHTDLNASEPPAWAPPDLAATAARLGGLTSRQLAALRGASSTVFVHVDAASLLSRCGVARVEGLGPMLLTNLADVLGHAEVTVQPVLDLRGQVRVDRYEHPDRLKDQAWLLSGGDAFPFSPRTATRCSVDFDHVVPFDRHGPPGQTGTHNAGPLRRRHHRWKTFGGYRCRHAGPGRHLWQTPHGLSFLVDHAGTRPLRPEEATVMHSAPAGVEIYPGPAVAWVGLPQTGHDSRTRAHEGGDEADDSRLCTSPPGGTR